MPRNGSGTMSLVYDFTDDRDAGIKILASRMDTQLGDIRDEITNSVAVNGESTMTGNLKMGSNKVTLVSAATLTTDAPNALQVQNGAFLYAASGGSANAYTLTLAPAITAYAAGQEFVFKANHLSTGAATLNVSGLGAKNILVEGLYNLPPYAIKNNQLVKVVYDGTQFQPVDLKHITGDVQPWLSSTVKPGWLVLDGTTTIGSAASLATSAAAVNEGLYRYLWDSCTDTDAAVSTGRGANAAADFAANKTLTLPTSKDRSMYGIGSTITQAMARTGAATVASTGTVGTSGATTISTATMPAHTHTHNNDQGGAGTAQFVASAAGSATAVLSSSTGGGGSHTHTGGTFTGDATNVLHPVFGVYLIIKI